MNKIRRTTMYKRNAGEVLNMSELAINIRCSKLIVKCLEIPHYAYTHRYVPAKKHHQSDIIRLLKIKSD